MPHQGLTFAADKEIDAFCFGRVGMDLYGVEEDKGLASVSAFRVSLGGSPGNIAVGMVRLGCRAGCISKVASDPVGDYVQETLVSEGVDTSCLLRDHGGNLTSLALAAMQNKNCEVVIYRKDAADLQLTSDEIESMPIAMAKVLLISGTALSTSPSREAAFNAMMIARKNRLRILLDLDYRPNTWGTPDSARTTYKQALSLSDLAIGNTEEWQIANPESSLTALVNSSDAGFLQYIILKDAERGSTLISKYGSKDYPAYRVKARKPYGAGDAFASALLQQLLAGADFAKAIDYGSASAAIVVQSDACALAMPDMAQLKRFIETKGR